MMTPDTVSPEVLPSDLPDTGASLDAEEVMYDGFGAVGVWLLALTMGLWLSYQ